MSGGNDQVRRLEVTGEHTGGRIAPEERGVVFKRARLEDADLSGQSLWYYGAQASLFVRCDFRDFAPEAGSLGSGRKTSTYRECRFDRADLRGVSPGYTRFERCSFDGATIAEWFASNAAFVDCSINATIRTSKFAGRSWNRSALQRLRNTRNEFAGNDFSGADIHDTSFVLGIDLSAQRLPVSPLYVHIRSAAARVEEARRSILGWNDDEQRADALLMLDVYEDDLVEQVDLFARRDDLSTMDPEVRDRVWALLEQSR